jgi:hypothetical protein
MWRRKKFCPWAGTRTWTGMGMLMGCRVAVSGDLGVGALGGEGSRDPSFGIRYGGCATSPYWSVHLCAAW